jgi:squalene-hopene/tetraprenyl-beta-curcumene cyclase
MPVTGSAETRLVRGAHAAGARAAAWLVEQRADDGLFRDFETYAGASDEWVTAYVSEALLDGTREPGPRAAATQALGRLALRQRPDGSWGYNGLVPGDCDSTAWTLLALRAAGSRPSPELAASRWLLRERRDDGAFATYGSPAAIARFIDEPEHERLRGWTSAHACVSAAALLALARALPRPARGLLDDSVAWLRAARDDDGTWPAYWWAGWGYATLHALLALAAAGALEEHELEAAADFALLAGDRDGGFGPEPGMPSEAFATALALRILLLRPQSRHRTRARAAAAWLLEAQRPDGSWEPQPILRIPEPFVLRPWTVTAWRRDVLGTGVQLRDPAATFTTATVLRALATVERTG